MDMKIVKLGFVSLLTGFIGLSSALGAEPVEPVDGLKQELKAAQTKINQLEEELFIATDGAGNEEEATEELPEGTHPWTEYMRRTPMGILFPTTSTIRKGEVYARFSHVSQNQLFTSSGDHFFHDLLGIEDGVKVGLMFGYGIMDNWDVTLQRTNGRDYYGLDAKDHSYDLWEIMTKIKLLDEQKQFVDLAVTGGATFFWQDDNRGEWAGNAALLLEKSLWRFRLGTGVLYTSLSDWERTESNQSGALSQDKYYPQEDTFGQPRPQNHTVAIPVSASVAITPSLHGFAELAFPVDGYETDRGPSAAAGCRIVTHSHAYSLFLSNTSNNSFNSTLTGGYQHDRLDVFGFDISIFF